MANYTWSIKSIEAEKEVITCAKYQVIANGNTYSIQTVNSGVFLTELR